MSRALPRETISFVGGGKGAITQKRKTTDRTPSTIFKIRSKPRFLPLMSLHAAPMQNLVEPFSFALRASLYRREKGGKMGDDR
jgi:hypothetical protein